MVLTSVNEHVYPFSFNVVSRAFWNKYPNPCLSHVERVDVLDRYLDDEGRLCSARLVHCRNHNLPKWTQRFLGSHAYVLEETVCDPVKKTLELMSQNLSFTQVATVLETCRYAVDPAAPESSTTYTQHAKVTAFVPLLAKKLEDFSVKAGKVTAGLGLEAMENICHDIFEGNFSFCESKDDSSNSNKSRSSGSSTKNSKK